MFKAQLTAIGDSTGIVLPPEVLAKLQAAPGDTVCLSETADGFQISPFSADFDEQMASARKIMHRYRGALRELAK